MTEEAKDFQSIVSAEMILSILMNGSNELAEFCKSRPEAPTEVLLRQTKDWLSHEENVKTCTEFHLAGSKSPFLQKIPEELTWLTHLHTIVLQLPHVTVLDLNQFRFSRLRQLTIHAPNLLSIHGHASGIPYLKKL